MFKKKFTKNADRYSFSNNSLELNVNGEPMTIEKKDIKDIKDIYSTS